MYNAVADVALRQQVDAVDLYPGVTPLEGPDAT